MVSEYTDDITNGVAACGSVRRTAEQLTPESTLRYCMALARELLCIFWLASSCTILEFYWAVLRTVFFSSFYNVKTWRDNSFQTLYVECLNYLQFFFFVSKHMD